MGMRLIQKVMSSSAAEHAFIHVAASFFVQKSLLLASLNVVEFDIARSFLPRLANSKGGKLDLH